MFFNNDNKLEEKIEEKDEQINTLQMAIKELNSEKKHNLNLKKEEINKLNETLKNKTKELEEKEKELEQKTRELDTAVDNLERVTSTDTITGAYNKRYFYDVAESIISLSKREKCSLSLAMLEINNFENLYKIHGNEAADQILQTFVHKIILRESDLFVRFSDKEFVILFPSTNAEQAMIVSEKIRKDIESSTFFNSINITVSLGLTEYILSEDNIYTALKRVTAALSEAKVNTTNSI